MYPQMFCAVILCPGGGGGKLEDNINLLKPTGYGMPHQFNIQQL
jgi:hypothetical protein